LRFGFLELELVVYLEFDAWDLVPFGPAEFFLAQPVFDMLILLGIGRKRKWDGSFEDFAAAARNPALTISLTLEFKEHGKNRGEPRAMQGLRFVYLCLPEEADRHQPNPQQPGVLSRGAKRRGGMYRLRPLRGNLPGCGDRGLEVGIRWKSVCS
jgi:hypothetical protein